jgi:hypothetical protein
VNPQENRYEVGLIGLYMGNIISNDWARKKMKKIIGKEAVADF